jgi:hypothetical protein
MEDIHYNKYIKYKTKYLELKEQRGSGSRIGSGIGEWFSALFRTQEEKIFGAYFDLLKKHQTSLTDINHIPQNQTYYTEQFLLPFILPQLYIYKNIIDYQQTIINIYKSFCNTINTYRSGQNIKEILSNNVLQLSIINTNLDNIKSSYKIDLPVLKKTISLYFQFLNTCIEKNIQFSNFNVCESNTNYLDNFLKNSFYNDNGRFKVELLSSPELKLFYAVHQSNLK